jgi:energy-coupling factor transporter ATP-binding protein EcfA2
MQSFKVLRLRLKENPIFDNIDINFYDVNDKPTEPYTTLIIGPNGTGKSNLLKIIIQLFAELSSFKKEGKRTARFVGKFCFDFELDGKFYRYLNFDFEKSSIVEAIIAKPRIWVNGVIMTHKQIEIPNSIIALSVMLTDKFPVDIDGFPNYAYLGVKVNSNTARTSTYVTKTINLLYESLYDNETHRHIEKALAFLGYEEVLYVSYYPRYKHIFFRDTLTEKLFHDFFTQYWKYTKREEGSPPWSVNTYKRIIDRNPERVKELVDLCNKLSGHLEREYEGSRTQYFEFDVFDNYLSQKEITLIKELHALDLISYPSIAFRKQKKYFMLEDSSSGEYHFISGFIGLLAKLKENSLVLIDEPENSLHPNWQMKYISLLKDVFKDFKSCHFLIATHSHFFVSDLNHKSSTIVGLNKGDNITATSIPANTYGWSAEDILLNIFRTPGTRNYYLSDQLGKIFELISKEPTEQIVINLKKQIADLKKLDLSGIKENDPLKNIIAKLFERFENV